MQKHTIWNMNKKVDCEQETSGLWTTANKTRNKEFVKQMRCKHI